MYNLRKSRTYRTVRRAWDHTRPSRVMIGERRRPNPRGQPGFVRVDTVLIWTGSVYHINVVKTQYEYVGTVAAISEAFLLPVLSAVISF